MGLFGPFFLKGHQKNWNRITFWCVLLAKYVDFLLCETHHNGIMVDVFASL